MELWDLYDRDGKVTVDCPKDSIVLQEGETTEYRWVDVAGLLEYVDSELAIKTHNDRYAAYFTMLREKREKDVEEGGER